MQYDADTNVFTLTLADARKIEKYTPAAYEKLPEGRKLMLNAYKDGSLHHKGTFSTSSFSFLKTSRWTIEPKQGLISSWFKDFGSISTAKVIDILSDAVTRRYHKDIKLKLA